MKRIVSLLFVVLMLGMMLVSCQQVESEGGETLPSDVVPSGDVDTTDTDANNFQNDRLPTGAELEALGFAGSEVRVLSWDKEEAQTFPKEDSSTDPIKSKLYYHWRSIEERFVYFNRNPIKSRARHLPLNDVPIFFLTFGFDYVIIFSSKISITKNKNPPIAVKSKENFYELRRYHYRRRSRRNLRRL